MSPPRVSVFFPSDDLCAHRAYLAEFLPVDILEGEEAARDLEDLPEVIAEAGIYRSGDLTFDLREPGVYRFQWNGRPGQQVVVLPDTPSGIASVASELGVLGNLDRNRSWDGQMTIAKRRRLAMHCVQFSDLSVRLAHMAGLSGMTWLMWNYEAVEQGDFLSSHSISEIRSRDGSEVRLYDLSFGVEFIVNEGQTDFSGFQSALMDGDPVDVRPVGAAFGFEYGSKFFGGYADDFELDALAADPEVLLEAHGRLVRGTYVIGQDVRSKIYATACSKAIAAAAPEAELDSAKRDQVERAQIIGPASPSSVDPPAESAYRLSYYTVGYSLCAGKLTPLTAGASGGDVYDASNTMHSGILMTGGTTIRVGDDSIDLSQLGLHRFTSSQAGRPIQAVTLSKDPSLVAQSFLEAMAAGGMFDGLPSADLRLATQTQKVTVQGKSAAELIQALFAPAKIQYRIWTLPTQLSDDPDWPVEGDFVFLEIGGADRQVHLFELGRGLSVTIGETVCGFSKLEQAVVGGGSPSLKQLCITPHLAYTTQDAASGLQIDPLLPLWYGSLNFVKSLMAESLCRYPAMYRDASGRSGTTVASKDKAKARLADGLGKRETMVAALDAVEIKK